MQRRIGVRVGEWGTPGGGAQLGGGGEDVTRGVGMPEWLPMHLLHWRCEF